MGYKVTLQTVCFVMANEPTLQMFVDLGCLSNLCARVNVDHAAMREPVEPDNVPWDLLSIVLTWFHYHPCCLVPFRLKNYHSVIEGIDKSTPV